MIHALRQKIQMVIQPAAIVDNTAFTTAEIDTAGFDYCQIYVAVGATDIAMAVLKVQESNTSGSGMADISGLDFDGDTAIGGSAAALPSATDDNKVFACDIDLRGRKRYLDLSATAGDGAAGTFAVAWAVLSRGEEGVGPSTPSDRGCENILRV